MLQALSRDGLTQEFIHSFWQKVNKTEDSNECWEWQAGKNSRGYGRVKIKGKVYRAHRVAYLLAYGYLDPQLHLQHICDNPSCINHNHLIPGTSVENHADKARKNRAVKHWGSFNGNSKLTKDVVTAIKQELKTGAGTRGLQAKLAHKFGVSQNTLTEIKKGTRWGWLKVDVCKKCSKCQKESPATTEYFHTRSDTRWFAFLVQALYETV